MSLVHESIFQIVASVFADMLTNFTPAELEFDLVQGELCLTKSLSDKVEAALLANGFIKLTDEFTTSYVDPHMQDRGVMVTEIDEPEVFAWAYFQR